MSKIQIFTGDSLFQETVGTKEIIKEIIREGEIGMLLGSEKAGKSILGLQMAAAISAGGTFLDKFEVPEPLPVAYLQLEGYPHTERLNRMRNAVEVNNENLFLLHKKFLPIDLPEFREELKVTIASLPKVPKVFFLDPLYAGMQGDLINNTDIRRFIAAASKLVEDFGFTMIIVHHEKRENFDVETHQPINLGDRGSYGSVFLRAWVDHILYLKKNKDKTRSLSCETQRSGSVLEEPLQLVLIEPNPLCFQLKGDYAAFVETVKASLRLGPKTKKQLCQSTGLSQDSVDKALRILFKSNLISKTADHEKTFKIA